MADIEVHAAAIEDGRIDRLKVHLHGLPSRVIDRDTALAWMRDGHSMIPVAGGKRLHALQLVEAGESVFIRHDNAKSEADALPTLPAL